MDQTLCIEIIANMSEKNFKVVEHVIEAQHIRENMRATLNSQEEVLHLAIKQYIPLNNPNPQPGDVTIIGCHANGFPKVQLKIFLVALRKSLTSE